MSKLVRVILCEKIFRGVSRGGFRIIRKIKLLKKKLFVKVKSMYDVC